MNAFEAIPFPKSENVTIRPMEAEETKKLWPYLQKLGWSISLPALSSAIVAEVGTEMVGFAVAQTVMHGEPIYVIPEYRASGVAEKLANGLAETMQKYGITDWVCVASDANTERLCRANGMVEVPGKIFVKRS